jgi:hypothetical protein
MNTNTNISVSAKVNHKDHNTTHPNHSEWWSESNKKQ